MATFTLLGQVMAVMAMSLRVVVPPHPLIGHWLTLLRDRSTPTPLFGTAMAELGRWLTYEALRDWLPTQEVELDTPLARTQGQVVDATAPLLAVPLLPAGLGLWQGAQAVLPAAQVAPLLPAAQGPWALDSLPEQLDPRSGVLVIAPLIASGASLLPVLERLRELGATGQRLRVVTSLAGAPGLKAISERFDDLTLYTACIDAEVDENGQLLPGCGDLGWRLHGTRARLAPGAGQGD